MTRMLTLAAAQTGSVDDGDLHPITECAHHMLDEAARQEVRLLSFCELFLTPFFANRLEEDFDRYFMASEHPALEGLRRKARSHGMALVLPFTERAADGFNSAQLLNEHGRVVGLYRKTHIPAYFPTAGAGGTGSFEKFYFAPGNALHVYPLAGTRVGVQICNDRLYPEASRVLALEGAELIAGIARKKFPWWRDRRPELYGPLAS